MFPGVDNEDFHHPAFGKLGQDKLDAATGSDGGLKMKC